jgi:hypothetical protein
MEEVMTKTLIQIQDEAIAKLLQERTSERRAMKLQRSVRQWYLAEVKKHAGLVGEQAFATWRDVKDMRDLHREAA